MSLYIFYKNNKNALDNKLELKNLLTLNVNPKLLFYEEVNYEIIYVKYKVKCLQ
jgi:hypothetical protein